jgi:hypothetical protein
VRRVSSLKLSRDRSKAVNEATRSEGVAVVVAGILDEILVEVI